MEVDQYLALAGCWKVCLPRPALLRLQVRRAGRWRV